MKRTILHIVASLTLLVGVVSPAFLQPVSVFALDANQQAVCDAIGTGTDCNTGGNGASKLNSTIAGVINIMSVLIGVLAVIMIIFAGFKYITSGGDSGKVTSAKHTMIYALVGLVIVALSQFIVKFVLGKVT